MRYINKVLIIQAILISQTACADGNDQAKTAEANIRQYLQVTGVENNDTLNLRKSPISKSEAVFTLPYNANGILMLGESKGWVQISYKEQTGWAYGKYLKSTNVPNVTSDIQEELFCIGTEPHWILKTKNNNLIYKKYDDEADYMFNSSFEKNENKAGSWSFSAINKNGTGSSINIVIEHNEQCSDEMSDNKYTYSISVNDKEMGVLNGCCNKK